MFPRRPTARLSPVLSAAERPVCVPYKRKPIRLNRRAAAPAASATVNIQKITKRAFDGRTLHGLKQLHNINLFVNFMFPRRPTARHSPMFSAAERPVCVPYKRKGTIPNRLIPKKVGSKSARRERVYKRAAETRRDFFRRGGARQAGGCHALPRGTELSSLCDDELQSVTAKFTD